jgi:hypothetical protein
MPAARFPIPPTLTAFVDLGPDRAAHADLLATLDPLAEEMARELRLMTVRRVSVRVSFHDGTERTATRILAEPAEGPAVVATTARPLLAGLADGEASVERISLEVGTLCPARPEQWEAMRPAVRGVAARGVTRRFPGLGRRAIVVYAALPTGFQHVPSVAA